MSSLAMATTNSGISYHGRILKADGTPLQGNSVQFQLTIRSPGNENCLLYQELQTLDMANSNGVFSLTINDGSGTRSDSTGIAFGSVFSNRSPYTLPVGSCSYGSSYTPNQADGRAFVVAFRDENMSSFETLPSQTIAFAPAAIQALNVAGYAPGNLLKFDDSVLTANASPLNNTQYANLIALINGTSTQYVKSSSTGGGSLPVVASAPTSASAGSIWFDSTTHTIKYNDGTATQTIGTGGGSGSVTSITAGAGLSGGTITTSGTIALGTVGTAGSYYKVNTDAYGRVTSGAAALVEADIPALTTAGHVAGSAINGTIGGSTILNTTGAITTTGVVTAGTVTTNSVGAHSVVLSNTANTHTTTLSAPTLTNDYAFIFPDSAGLSGNMLITDGAGHLSWTSAGGTPSGTAGGDLAGTYPNPTVAGLRGKTISATLPTAAGQVLKYDGTSTYAPGFINGADVRSSLTGSAAFFPTTACTASQTLAYSSVTDSLSCATVSVTAAAGILPVANGGTGTATGSITGTGALTFAAGGTNQNVSLTPSGTGNTVLGGNVGIGTTSPASPLTVAGIIQSTTGGIKFPDGTTQTTSAAGGASQWTTTGSNISYSAGNVSIGTTSSAGRLQIAGATNSSYLEHFLSSGGNDIGGVFQGPSGEGQLYLSNGVGANTVLLNGGGNSYFNGGNVGIGTTSPTASLVVDSGGTNNIALRDGSIENHKVNGAAAVTVNFYGYNGGVSQFRDFGIYNGKGAPISYFQGSSGNVGIGTTSPASPLTVAGVIQSTAGGIKFPDGTTQTTAASAPASAAISGLTAANAVNSPDSLNFAQTWNWSTATTQNPMTMTANGLTTGSLLSLTSSNASLNSTSGLLNVANTGSSTSGTVARIQSNSTAGSGLTVLANGNVGIGTTSPNVALAVAGNANLNGILNVGTFGATINYNGSNVFNVTGNPGSGGYAMAVTSGSLTGGYAMKYFSNSTLIGSVDNLGNLYAAGNVGVGTTSAQSGLDVSTTGTNSAMIVPRDSTANRPTTAVNGMIRYNTSNSQLESYIGGAWVNLATSASGGPISISSLLAAASANSIENTAYQQTWNWNALGATSGLNLSTTSTAALGNAQKVLNISASGANSNAGQTTYGLALSNTHSGSSSSNVGLYVDANGGTNNYAAIFNTGNVGVGALYPSEKLTVAGNILVDSSGANTGTYQNTLKFGSNDRGIAIGSKMDSGGNQYGIDFYTSYINRLAITSGGNVGIGTTSPTSPLTVAGVIQSTTGGIKFPDGTTQTTAAAAGGSAAISGLTAATATNSPDSLNFAQTWNWSTATTQNPMTMTANGLTTGSLLSLTSSNTSLNSTSGLLNVANTGTSTTGTVARIQSNSTAGSGLTVLANGNIGVGTTSPTQKLTISGGGLAIDNANTIALNGGVDTNWRIGRNTGAITKAKYTGATMDFIASGNGGEGLVFGGGGNSYLELGPSGSYFSGNVGIGTTSPSQTLQVSSSSAPAIQLGPSTAANDTANIFLSGRQASTTYTSVIGAGQDGSLIYSSTSGNHYFRNGAAAQMTILPSGNVGIGTASPASLLDVNGVVRLTQICDHAGANCSTPAAIASIAAPTLATVTANGASTSTAVTFSGGVSASSYSGAGTGLTGTASGLTVGAASTAATATYANSMHSYNTGNNMQFGYTGSAWAFYVDGSYVKTFVINHPTDTDRYLVHGTLEGPEGAVFYRGEAELSEGQAEIKLPTYFEALTRKEGRTVLLTTVGGFDPISVDWSAGQPVHDGKFAVISNQPHSKQRFYWEVKAVRADVAPLEVEPMKRDHDVHGVGPYTYATKAARSEHGTKDKLEDVVAAKDREIQALRADMQAAQEANARSNARLERIESLLRAKANEPKDK